MSANSIPFLPEKVQVKRGVVFGLLIITALVASGLPTDRFTYIGFLPRKSGTRRSTLEAISAEMNTIVINFYFHN